jgi:hypothetical protein
VAARTGASDYCRGKGLGSCLWPFPVRRLWVGCWWVRPGRVAAAPPACGGRWGKIHWTASCARGTLRLRRAPTRQEERRRRNRCRRSNATAGTGRCTPSPNPKPGFQAAGQWGQWSGRAVAPRKTCTDQPASAHHAGGALGASVVPSGELLRDGRCLGPPAASASRRPLLSHHPKQHPREGGQATPGKYVVLNFDRVNLHCEGERRRGSCGPSPQIPAGPAAASVSAAVRPGTRSGAALPFIHRKFVRALRVCVRYGDEEVRASTRSLELPTETRRADGRLFRSPNGGVAGSLTYYRVWAQARRELCPVSRCSMWSVASP